MSTRVLPLNCRTVTRFVPFSYWISEDILCLPDARLQPADCRYAEAAGQSDGGTHVDVLVPILVLLHLQ